MSYVCGKKKAILLDCLNSISCGIDSCYCIQSADELNLIDFNKILSVTNDFFFNNFHVFTCCSQRLPN